MTQSTSIDIQRGWKVFAKSEEIGEVVRIGSRDIDVQKGMLTKHTYRVPREHIAEASDGIVDLAIDRQRVEEYALGRLDDGDPEEALPGELPEEYRRLEYGGDGSPEQPDLPILPR